MRKSLVSIIALGLFAGAPAMAQTTTGEATTNQTAMTQYQQQTTTLDAEQMQELLSEFDERSEIEGRIARAFTAEGNQVLVFVGPQDLEADASFEAEDSDIRDRFEEAGFTTVEILDDARIARAEFDDDHYIFAMSADQIMRFGTHTGTVTGEPGTDLTRDQTALGGTATDTTTQLGQTDTQTGTMGQADTQLGQTGTATDTQVGETYSQVQTGQIGRALSEPDADRIVSSIEDAGLEDAAEFHGRLFQAMSEDGVPVFFLITSRDMDSDAEINISDVDVREKLEEANLENFRSIDNVRIVRGSLEDNHVFVLAGDLTPMGQ